MLRYKTDRTWVRWYQNDKPFWLLIEQELMEMSVVQNSNKTQTKKNT